jgi:Glycosyl hydrolase family 9/Cellulase N-terminal ig-like domain
MTNQQTAARTIWTRFPLMSADLGNSLDAKVRSKPVYETLILDDMETDSGWQASPAVELGYTADRAHSGTRSLRFTTRLRDDSYIAASRQPNGSFSGQAVLFDGTPFSASAHLRFAAAQDWTRFNRISLWCYLHPADNPITTLSLQFLCEGAPAGPTDPISIHYIGDLKPGKWNLLTWEIPEIRRDRVIEFIIFQPLSGVPNAGADTTVSYDFDALSLDRVDAERVAGWEIDPGKISYSHIGYVPEGQKIALVGDTGVDHFELVDSRSGAVVYSAPLTPSNTRLGAFGVLDFSDVVTPGEFILRVGEVASAPFPIHAQAWRVLLEATLNAFYGLRCGIGIEGVHDPCHLDVLVRDGDQSRVVGGGWHDAANLTQGPGRTHLSIYALLELHEALASTDTELAERALEEALWGITWSLRMRFGPGRRCLYGEYSYYTDGIPGTDDDVVQDNVGSDTFQNILATLAAARAARVWASRDPELGAELLRAAEEDFAAVLVDRPRPPGDSPSIEINEASWRDEVGYLTLAAVELFRATGSSHYEAEATRLARWLIELQETRFIDGSPVTGYFYEDAARTRIVHEYHNSFEESAPAALAALCDAFPDHPDWIDWRASLIAYSEYFCRKGAEASAPYDLLPAAVWRRSDLDAPGPDDETGARLAMIANPVFPTPPTADLIRSQFEEMFEAATYLSAEQRLRMFPLWYDHVRHGSSTVHLSKTAALLSAAVARGRSDLAELSARQLGWIVGANPFSRSIVYGVGADWWQNFTVSLPNLVGGLSLGFNSYEGDAPAWGNNAVFPYKEMWVYSSCRLALNLARVAARARMVGTATAGATLRNVRTRAEIAVPQGAFDLSMPAGEYDVHYGGITRRVGLVGGSTRRLQLDSSSPIAIDLDYSDVPAGGFIRASVAGSGRHLIELRASNASTETTRLDVELEKGVPLSMEWPVRIIDPLKPWALVVVPDGLADDAVEAFGGANGEIDLSARVSR